MATRPKHAAYLKKDPSPVQTEFAVWIEKVTGHVVPVGDVALVQRLYPLYLKTPEVVKAREAAAVARKKEEEERAARVLAKKKARLAAIEAERQRLAAELGVEVGPALSVVPDADEVVEAEVVEDESTGLVLGESDDEFVEPQEEDPEESDDDLWEDDDNEVEDF